MCVATCQQPVVCCFVTNLLSSNALHVSSTSSQAEENPKWLHAALCPSFLLAAIKKTHSNRAYGGWRRKKVGGWWNLLVKLGQDEDSPVQDSSLSFLGGRSLAKHLNYHHLSDVWTRQIFPAQISYVKWKLIPNFKCMGPLNILKLHLPPIPPLSLQPALWGWIVIFLVSLSFNHAPLSSVSCSPLGVAAVDHLFASVLDGRAALSQLRPARSSALHRAPFRRWGGGGGGAGNVKNFPWWAELRSSWERQQVKKNKQI